MSSDAPIVDIMSLSPEQFEIYVSGRSDGYIEGEQVGYDRGWQAADAHAAALHHRAHTVVQTMAALPSHDELEAARRRRAIESAQRWATEGEALSG